ncbi:diguanylate cyclase [Modestobacter sp. Leaf380]|uniref:GGDEF domain-containing protein n=1 Tax=Modestobacter sp. Leaf380 TaxID=1736356 RepID=UPI0006FF75C8|nr:GGDEF domain-containing protein [Modestobacter sp. Leaf380]KQS66947.1 hypothetical protein ASG41_11255 [Modestobacter sp. Leaf380]
MPHPTPPGRPDAGRTRVLAALVGASAAIGLLALLDPTTLRPGAWTAVFLAVLGAAALTALALLTVGRDWSDAVLGLLVCCLMGLVLLSVLANQSRAGGMLNVVLLLPNAVYAAVYLSRAASRAAMVTLTACTGAAMGAITSDPLQWLTLVALPLLAFLGTTEVVLRLRHRLGSALEALHRQTVTDPLTGLLNRRALQDRVAATAGGTPGTTTVAVLDIDRFKTVNDTLGHAAGDELLRRFAAGLAAETRDEDVVVRLGGEEFLVLSTTPADRAGAYAETLRVRAAEWMADWSATVSIGVVTLAGPPPDGLVGAELEAAVQAADACLYAAKRGGRDRVVLAEWPRERPAGADAVRAGVSG